MSLSERIRRRPEKLPGSEIDLSPSQLSEILLFKGRENKHNDIPFKVLGGVLEPDEQAILVQFSEFILNFGISWSGSDFSLQSLRDLAIFHGSEASGVFDKLNGFLSLRLISARDIASNTSFSKLPPLAQRSFATLGKNPFARAKQLLESGTVISYLEFNKPYPAYVEAIKSAFPNSHDVAQKANLAMYSPPDEVREKSHEFVTFRFIPKVDSQIDQVNDLNTLVEKRMSEIERNFGELVLRSGLLHEQSKGVLRAMALIPLTAPFLYWLHNLGDDNLLLQSVIKFIPPMLADFVTSYAHLRPWLEGDTSSERIIDWLKKLGTSQLPSTGAVFGATAVGAGLSEVIADEYGDIPGSIVYGAIPLFVAFSQSLTALRLARKELGGSYFDVFKRMFITNPAQPAVDISAFVTFLTAVGVLGVGGQFHNPTAITMIEGVEEHTLAAILTWLANNILHKWRFEQELNDKNKNWSTKNLISD